MYVRTGTGSSPPSFGKGSNSDLSGKATKDFTVNGDTVTLTLNNPYTTPRAGYVFVSPSQGMITVRVQIGSFYTYLGASIQNDYAAFTLVPKGAILQVTNTNNGLAYFVPTSF